MSNNKDYVFHLNWEDRIKNAWRVGYLAQIDKEFYFVISSEKNAESAYANGFIGIPGFKPGEIYKSHELFDFFKNRILNKESDDPCSELLKNGGRSMVDSFSLEQVSEILLTKQKEILMEAYQKQEEIKKIREKNRENTERDA